MSSSQIQTQSSTLLGHPTGLFTLFFAEMWERFSYYGMRALLVFYMIKGFLGYSDNDAYAVYGAYTALVYATPFIGGMLADHLLGARRAVVLGGLLMAAGHLAMTVENETVFFIALALLICGNGFFKPNISTIVGGLYPKGSAKKDTGFTIFYMGINLGAAMSPILCGYIGETYGWHYGFGLATVGMLIGVAVFVAPTRLTQLLILGGALSTAIAMPMLQDTLLQLAVRIFMALALAVAGVIAFAALGRGGLPERAGTAPSEKRLTDPALPKLRENIVSYYLAIIAAIFILQHVTAPSSLEAWMLAGLGGVAIVLPWVSARSAVYVGVAGAIPTIVLLVRRSEVAGLLLLGFGALAFGSLLREALRANKIERERMYVVLILMFFSMLFWAFFEQAGSSVNNFTDRNIDRVFEQRTIAEEEVGSMLTFRVPPRVDRAKNPRLADLPLLSQEQLGYRCDDEVFDRIDRAKQRQDAEKGQTTEKSDQTGPDEQWLPRLTQAIETLLKEKKEDPPELESDKQVVSVSVSPPKILEDGEQKLVYTFGRAGPTTEPLTVRFKISGTAKAKDNYTQAGAASYGTASGTVKFSAGVESATLTIDPQPDNTVEGNETIVLTVVPGAGYRPGDPSEATGTIENDDKFFTMTHLAILRDEAAKEDAGDEDKTITWTITPAHVGMGVGGAEIPASEFQAANPIFILLFGLVFSGLWAFLGALRLEPSTAVKFALGLMQLGLAFGAFWYGAHLAADQRGMVAMFWLLLGYLLQTTGELCLSPVGLSMVTKLSPTRIVSTVMGAWFLATAFSNYLAGMIATFTGVVHEGEGEQMIPAPVDTVHLYGDVFGVIALTAIASGLICLALAPLLTRWTHPEIDADEATGEMAKA
ncbi:MAG: MFS transporter [Pirellulales bacterium]|nr:MFS transporter [Pirellulales bacterium]